MRTPAENAQLALLLEVAGTPKPGNVDRRRDLGDLRFEHFLAGAVGAGAGFRSAEAGAPVGAAFERAVAGASEQRGGNTQFGCLLLLTPLIRAAATDALTPDGAAAVVESTTVDDAVGFFCAFDRVDVSVPDPPPDASELDVRRGADAIPALRARGLTLYDVLQISTDPDDGISDGNAREWTTGFRRTFAAADRLGADEGPAPERVARVFLDLLAEAPDSHVATRYGADTAAMVRRRAAEVRDRRDAGDDGAVERFAEELATERINPGTTADATAAAAFVALERGLPV